MKKIYKIQGKTSAMFTLTTNHGQLSVCYKFDHGNPLTNVPARLALDSEFAQNLLESSAIFKRRVVTLERVVKENAEKKEEVKYAPVKGVTNVSQAIDYIANTYAVTVKNTKQAVDFAHKHGFDFVDMKTKED